jgi:hypothetical protein
MVFQRHDKKPDFSQYFRWLLRCGLGWCKTEIQNITLRYDEEVIDWFVSSVGGSSLRLDKAYLWINRYYFMYTVIYYISHR